MNVLFVCAGNTCRSPFAEHLARRDWPGAEFASAGLRADDGASCVDEAVQVARDDFRLDLTGHRARRLTEELVEEADWVVCMTREQAERVALDFGGSGKTLTLGAEDVDDPYGGTPDDYRRAYRLIEAGIRDLAPAGAA